MADKKKQHYVPKTYMKHFTNEENKFTIINIKKDCIIEDVHYADQCYKNYYYGSDLNWENRLEKMENEWAGVFWKVEANEELSREDIKLLKQFAVYQRQRTLAEGNYRKEEKLSELKELARLYCVHKKIKCDDKWEEQFVKIAEETVNPIDSLNVALRAEELIEDLMLKVIQYKTKTNLISSDVPVISINQFEEHAIGYGCMGLVLFFPICKDKLIVIYDSGMYLEFGNEQYISVYDENEVENINKMQYLSAENLVFAKSKKDLIFVNEEIVAERIQNRSIAPIQTLGSDEHKMMIYSNRRVVHKCDLSFTRMGHAARKIPYSCREAVPRIWEKEWQDKLHTKEEIMPMIINQIPNMKEELGMSAKEAKRGCRLMTRFAELYWQKNKSILNVKGNEITVI